MSAIRLPFEVLVFVRRGADFLVLHRTKPGEVYWHPVAGALEDGETAAEAAVRELAEELGLQSATPVDLGTRFVYALADEPHRRSRFAPGVEEVVVDCFVVDVQSGWEPRLDGEHDDYRWCSPAEAHELLHWPEPRAVLAALAVRG